MVLGRSKELTELTREEEALAVEAQLQDYFNLQVSLGELWDGFSAADERFRALVPYVLGSRMMRQDPYECLFSFICSQNNHISRIHLMVDRLCARYGTPLVVSEVAEDDKSTLGKATSATIKHEPQTPENTRQRAGIEDGSQFFAFPTEEQLAEATEVFILSCSVYPNR